MQGDDDLGLRFEFSSLLIKVSDTFYMLNAQRTLSETVALFDGYDPEKSHIGKVETVATENGEEHIYYYGDTNEVTGEVYLMVEGETSLYTVSYTSLNVFQYTADELIQVITAEVEPEETSE